MLKVGITAGANNTKGYETIINVLAEPELLELCTPVFFASASSVFELKNNVKTETPIQFNLIKHASDALDGKVNVVGVSESEEECLKASLAAFMNNQIHTLVAVTDEISDSATSSALSELCASVINVEMAEVFSWTVNNSVKILSLDKLCNIPELVKGLRRDNKELRPRIAVVSDDESLGETLSQFREEGMLAFGPFKAEEFINEDKYQPYDALLFINKEKAANDLLSKFDEENTIGYISGLPMPLTHISCEAQPHNLRCAIYLGIDIYRARIAYRQATQHPLEKHWVPRGKDDYKLDLTKESDE